MPDPTPTAPYSTRRIVTLYVAGILIGFAGGLAAATMLWGLSLVH